MDVESEIVDLRERMTAMESGMAHVDLTLDTIRKSTETTAACVQKLATTVEVNQQLREQRTAHHDEANKKTQFRTMAMIAAFGVIVSALVFFK